MDSLMVSFYLDFMSGFVLMHLRKNLIFNLKTAVALKVENT